MDDQALRKMRGRWLGLSVMLGVFLGLGLAGIILILGLVRSFLTAALDAVPLVVVTAAVFGRRAANQRFRPRFAKWTKQNYAIDHTIEKIIDDVNLDSGPGRGAVAETPGRPRFLPGKDIGGGRLLKLVGFAAAGFVWLVLSLLVVTGVERAFGHVGEWLLWATWIVWMCAPLLLLLLRKRKAPGTWP